MALFRLRLSRVMSSVQRQFQLASPDVLIRRVPAALALSLAAKTAWDVAELRIPRNALGPGTTGEGNDDDEPTAEQTFTDALEVAHKQLAQLWAVVLADADLRPAPEHVGLIAAALADTAELLREVKHARACRDGGDTARDGGKPEDDHLDYNAFDSDDLEPDDLEPDDLEPDDLEPDDLEPDDLEPDSLAPGPDGVRESGGEPDGGGDGAPGAELEQGADDAFLEQWLSTVGEAARSLVDTIWYDVDDPAAQAVSDLGVGKFDGTLAEQLKQLCMVGWALIEILTQRRQELLLAQLAAATGGAREDDKAERKRIAAGLEKLRVHGRRGNCKMLWVCLDPEKLANPHECHVLMHTRPSIFQMGGGRAYGRVERAAQRYRYTTQWARSRPWPADAPGLVAMVHGMAQRTVDLEHEGVQLSSQTMRDRAQSLVRFLWMAVGTRQQRLLLAGTSVLQFAGECADAGYTYYEQSVVFSTVAALGTAAVSKNPSASLRSKLYSSSLLRVVAIMVFLRAWATTLKSLGSSMRTAVDHSIRNSFIERLTRHVLAQDLADVDEAGDEWDKTPSHMLETMTDEHTFDHAGLGSILGIPEQLMQSAAQCLSSASILLGKSPRLVLVLYLVMVGQKLLLEKTREGINWLSDKLGFSKRLCRTSSREDDAEWDLEQVLENFEDMRVNAKELELLRSMKRRERLERVEDLRKSFLGRFFKPVTIFLSDLPSLTVAYYGGILAQAGSMAPGDLGGFQSALQNVINSGSRLLSKLKSLSSLNDDRFDYCFQLMDMLEKKPTIGLDGGWQPPPPPKQRAGASTQGLKRALDPPEYRIGGEVEFRGVSFKYPGSRKLMLKSISFTVKPGTFVGICGERGAGKTTMFKLLLRLYDPESGVVRIGGRDIKEYNPVWLRSQIGLSKQNPAIFTDYGSLATLRANLTYGSEFALKRYGSPEQIEKHLLHILESMNVKEHFTGEKYPQGLDTKLRGGRLSGGETRSVANTRAMVASPAILLLDEFTAGLDAWNEQIVTKAMISDRPAGQTVIAVAQTLSTIREADQIIFVGADGTIKEQGTWGELVALKGGFADFVRIQSLEREPAAAAAAARRPTREPSIAEEPAARRPRRTSTSTSDHGAGATPGSASDEARGVVRRLKRIARTEGLHSPDLRALFSQCDNLLHTIQRNELLNPARGPASSNPASVFRRPQRSQSGIDSGTDVWLSEHDADDDAGPRCAMRAASAVVPGRRVRWSVSEDCGGFAAPQFGARAATAAE